MPFNFDQESLTCMPFLHYALQFWPSLNYALLALCPSILTKSELCPSCTIPFSFDQEPLTPFLHYTLLDQESLMPVLHYTHQFGPSQLCPSCTIICPSILTKSIMPFLHYALQFWPGQLCPSCTIICPSILTKSIMPFLHYTLQFRPRVTYALLALYPSIWAESQIPFQKKSSKLI